MTASTRPVHRNPLSGAGGLRARFARDGSAHDFTPRRALSEVTAAAKAYPGSRRNNYYSCMMSLQQGRAAEAVPYCEAAMRARCAGPTEPDYCAFLASEVERVLAKARIAAAA